LNEGIKNIAVVLIHSYSFQDHEIEIGKIAEELGFEQISLSCKLIPMIRYSYFKTFRVVERGLTTCVDAC
jgi:5-oxoprolinase (ATP-hydrolysing)